MQMTDPSQLGAGSLTAAIDETIAKLLEMKLPSLRTIHSARQQLVKLNFDRDRPEQLRLRASNERPAHPGHRDLAEAWIDTLQAALSPARLLTLYAKVVPSTKAITVESAAYFAATVMAVSTWPVNLPYTEETYFF